MCRFARGVAAAAAHRLRHMRKGLLGARETQSRSSRETCGAGMSQRCQQELMF